MTKRKCGLRMAAGGLIQDDSRAQIADANYQAMQAKLQVDAQARAQQAEAGKASLRELEGSRMSPGRKARMMAEVAGDLGKLGVKTDLSSAARGLSPGRAARIDMAQGDVNNAVTQFGADRAKEQIAAQNAQQNAQIAATPSIPSILPGGTPLIGETSPRQGLGQQPLGMRTSTPSGPTGTNSIMRSGSTTNLLDEPTNLAEGGIVRGKGGPTDDEVPMRVAGRDVNLSNAEAVLPAKTVQALGGPKAVEALIEETNGKPPVRGGLRQGGNYYTGAVGDEILQRELRPEFKSQLQTAPIQSMPDPRLEEVRNARAQVANAAHPNAPGAGIGTQNPNVTRGVASSEATKFAAQRAAQDARFAPAQPAAPKPVTAWQGLKTAAGAAAMAAPVVAAAMSDEPIVSGKLREGALSAIPFAKTNLGERERAAVPGKGGWNLKSMLQGETTTDRINKIANTERAQLNKAMVDGDGGGVIPDLATPKEKAAIMKQNARSFDRAEAQAEGRPSVRPETESMAALASMGVETRGLRRQERENVNMVDGDGPRKVAQDELRVVNTGNGERVYAARGKNGQLNVVGGMDRTPAEQQAAQAQSHKEAVELNARNGALAKNMEMDRYKRWATDPSITDPAARAAGLRGMQVMGAQEAGSAAEVRGAREDRRLDLKDRREAQIADRQTAAMEASARTEARKTMNERGKGVRDTITTMFKDDPAKIEATLRYASQLERGEGEDDNSFISRVLREHDADAKIGKAQQHWLKFGDTGFNGEAQSYRKYEPSTFERLRMGLRGDHVYQSVHDKDNILNLAQAGLTPQQLQFFLQNRVVQ